MPILHQTKTKAFLIVSSVLLACCQSFVEVGPPQTSLTGLTVFESDATASSGIIALYEKLMEAPGFVSGDGSVSVITALSSDELKDYTGKNKHRLHWKSTN